MVVVKLKFKNGESEFLEFNTHYDAEIFIHSIPFMQLVDTKEFNDIQSAKIEQISYSDYDDYLE